MTDTLLLSIVMGLMILVLLLGASSIEQRLIELIQAINRLNR